MGKSGIVSPDDISLEEFNKTLARYPSVIRAVSETKGAKPGQKSLEALDKFRYDEAPARFGAGKSSEAMTLEDVKALVEWKLRHGKFRPTLMSLVSSNDAKTTQKTIQTALASYGGDGSATKAAAALTALRGIGPATASLLVAVHDGARAPFFSDEVFSWLCCDGQAAPSIKYNAKEYGALCARVAEVRERLGVAAVDIERVAFVLLRGDQGGGDKVAREDGKGSQAVAGKKGPKKGGDEVKAEPRSVKPAAGKKGPKKGGDEVKAEPRSAKPAAGKKGPKKGGDEVKAEPRPVKPAAAVGKPTTKRKKSEESRGAEAAEPSRRSKRGKHS